MKGLTFICDIIPASAVFFIFLFCPYSVFPENEAAGPKLPIGEIEKIPQDIITRTVNIKEDLATLGGYLVRPDKTAMIKLLATGAGTAFLMLVDEDIRHEVKKRSGQTLDSMERIFEPLGRWEIQGIAGAGTLGAGYLMKDRKLVEASLTGLEAYLISGSLVEIIKLTCGRERPYEEKGSDAFFEGGVSFPSGHAARSFAWAATISQYYHDKKIVPVLSYGVAALVSLSRLESDRHWASDAFFGACLGFGIGKGLSHLHLKEDDKYFSLLPVLNDDTVGLSSTVKF